MKDPTPEILQCGGRIVHGQPKEFDGIEYQYRTTWDSDEDADKFLEMFSDYIIKHDRSVIDGYLVMFFSTHTIC